MNPTEAERKAFQKAQDFSRKTERPDVFWKELYTDIERKKRLIELEKTRRSFQK